MDGNGTSKSLNAKQLRAIPYLLAAPSIELGCKMAKVGKATVYEWMKEGAFREALKRQRDEMIERALDSLKASITKATETLVKLLGSDKEAIQARAAEDIIEFTQKAVEFENLEKRIEALEERIKQQEGRGRGW